MNNGLNPEIDHAATLMETFLAGPMSGEEIERRSFEIIDREAPATAFSDDEWAVVRRMIHTVGDFSLIDAIRFSPGFIDRAVEALRACKPIFADSNMIRTGLSLARLQAACPEYNAQSVRCHVADEDVAAAARREGLPRSLFAARKALPLLEGGIALFGNAPVALMELNHRIVRDGLRPAFVIAAPVGFVHVVESKEELMTLSVPYLCVTGRRGGSPLAVAALHALCGLAARRTGYTTGTCAAAAAKAAALILSGAPIPETVSVALPDGVIVNLPVETAGLTERGAEASVKKDAGDDPDVTDGRIVRVEVEWSEGPGVSFHAGEGVGVVTKPGLALPVGEPAINPTPRRMIDRAIHDVTDRPVKVTVSVPGGEELALKTFNPRLGIKGGLSILGTSGIVRPFSLPALRDALLCGLRVAHACGVSYLILTPGRIGAKAARTLFNPPDECIVEVGNEWGFALDHVDEFSFKGLLLVGHPGKLAKLPRGHWDTHSKRSPNAVEGVIRLCEELLGFSRQGEVTVEGFFSALDDHSRRALGERLARDIVDAVSRRIDGRADVAVVLVDLRGAPIGSYGDVGPWTRTQSASS
jgi:cobalt-precorrin-5B (C1)-methyltransferase